MNDLLSLLTPGSSPAGPPAVRAPSVTGAAPPRAEGSGFRTMLPDGKDGAEESGAERGEESLAEEVAVTPAPAVPHQTAVLRAELGLTPAAPLAAEAAEGAEPVAGLPELSPGGEDALLSEAPAEASAALPDLSAPAGAEDAAAPQPMARTAPDTETPAEPLFADLLTEGADGDPAAAREASPVAATAPVLRSLSPMRPMAAPPLAESQTTIAPPPDLTTDPAAGFAEAPAPATEAEPLPRVAAAPPQAEAPVAQPSALLRNLRDRLDEIVLEEGRSRFLLRPRGLGVVEIDLTRLADGRMQVALRLENPLVLESLRAEASALGAHLESRGFDLGGGNPEFSAWEAPEDSAGGSGAEVAGEDSGTPPEGADPAAGGLTADGRLNLLT